MTLTDKLTPYDPADDLGTDEAIAVFMDEAFGTNNAAYVATRWAWWHAPRAWRRWPSTRVCRASSSIDP